MGMAVFVSDKKHDAECTTTGGMPCVECLEKLRVESTKHAGHLNRAQRRALKRKLADDTPRMKR